MISVIIPCYNSEKTIVRCLMPLLTGPFRDFEVLIMDDGSSDGTLAVCAALDDPRVRLFPAEKNEGVSRARNRGLDAARGDHVAFIDADDTVPPDYLEVLSGAALAGDPDWTASAFAFVDEQDPDKEVHTLPPAFPEDITLRMPALKNVLPGRIFFNGGCSTLASVCGCLYRRSILEEHRIRFRSGLRYGEDTLFNLQFSAHCNSFSYVSRKLYRYHQHEGEATDVMFRRYSVRDFAAVLKAMEEQRLQTGTALSAAESNYVLSQTFGFINHNALLKPREEAAAFFAEMERCYWSEPPIRALWESMQKRDIRGRLAQLRFSLIRNKRWGALQRLQDGIRLVRKVRG
ncbi:MAG: glycosyltransferase family 2 protein [Lachnospiraceae bacterium]|nr:glycosyltransferase family 2 protein [Lachnospiraceae bacterium]